MIFLLLLVAYLLVWNVLLGTKLGVLLRKVKVDYVAGTLQERADVTKRGGIESITRKIYPVSAGPHNKVSRFYSTMYVAL